MAKNCENKTVRIFVAGQGKAKTVRTNQMVDTSQRERELGEISYYVVNNIRRNKNFQRNLHLGNFPFIDLPKVPMHKAKSSPKTDAVIPFYICKVQELLRHMLLYKVNTSLYV